MLLIGRIFAPLRMPGGVRTDSLFTKLTYTSLRNKNIFCITVSLNIVKSKSSCEYVIALIIKLMKPLSVTPTQGATFPARLMNASQFKAQKAVARGIGELRPKRYRDGSWVIL